jgi:hypothetical protein
MPRSTSSSSTAATMALRSRNPAGRTEADVHDAVADRIAAWLSSVR